MIRNTSFVESELEPNSVVGLKGCILYDMGRSARLGRDSVRGDSTRTYPRRGWDHSIRVITTKGTEMQAVMLWAFGRFVR